MGVTMVAAVGGSMRHIVCMRVRVLHFDPLLQRAHALGQTRRVGMAVFS